MTHDQLNEAAGRDWCENVLDRDLKPITKQAFKRGAQWHKSLSLAERLTESEQEKIMQFYQIAKDSNSDYHRGYADALLRFFGPILFTDKPH